VDQPSAVTQHVVHALGDRVPVALSKLRFGAEVAVQHLVGRALEGCELPEDL
jgi:hypothetical protein